MSSLALTLYGLLLALLGYALACGLALGVALRPGQPRRAAWAMLATALLLLGLEHAYALELAWSSGLHDLRQAVLGAAGGLAALAATALFRRRS